MNKPEILTDEELREIVVSFIAENESKPLPLLSQDINKLLPGRIAQAQLNKDLAWNNEQITQLIEEVERAMRLSHDLNNGDYFKIRVKYWQQLKEKYEKRS